MKNQVNYDRLQVAATIRELRKSKHISQEDLAQRTQRTAEMISRIEREGGGLTVDALVRIAAALEVSPSYLLGLEEARHIPLEYQKIDEELKDLPSSTKTLFFEETLERIAFLKRYRKSK